MLYTEKKNFKPRREQKAPPQLYIQPVPNSTPFCREPLDTCYRYCTFTESMRLVLYVSQLFNQACFLLATAALCTQFNLIRGKLQTGSAGYLCCDNHSVKSRYIEISFSKAKKNTWCSSESPSQPFFWHHLYSFWTIVDLGRDESSLNSSKYKWDFENRKIKIRSF